MTKLNLKTLAYEKIKQKIITCEYAPGSMINEELLTQDLGISRTPVRDAISRLEQEGFVKILPKHGIMVPSLTVNDINMNIEIRKLYEPYILLHYGILIPDEENKKYYNIFSTESDSSIIHDPEFFHNQDDAFHFMIVNSCPNVYIRSNYALVRSQDERIRYVTRNDISMDRIQESCNEHQAIILACMQKNWSEAAHQMDLHIENTKKITFQQILNNIQYSSFNI